MDTKNIIFLIIGVILLAGVVYYIGIEEVIVVLKQADPELLFAAFLLNLAQLLVWNFKFKSLFGKIKKVSYLPLFTSQSLITSNNIQNFIKLTIL